MDLPLLLRFMIPALLRFLLLLVFIGGCGRAILLLLLASTSKFAGFTPGLRCGGRLLTFLPVFDSGVVVLILADVLVLNLPVLSAIVV
jgi:hypothetical protein